ncbi:MAG: TPM domain-containing protein [Clostridium sp.]|nr:TPM domain-containing protein [Clostridium sp.]MCM1444211.1 TPM domain-containing protein [Candidatus Amulumruptor caecigallinarius]
MKKIFKTLFICILFLIFNINSYASTNVIDRTTLDNYGVNKKWNITESNKSNVLNTYKVDASEKIYDYSDILDYEEEKKLYNKIKTFINKTEIDMVFVSINLPYTYDSKNEDFAADFYDYNDFGIDFENYSGVLLLRNTYEKDPYFNVYTFGNAQLYFSYERCEDVLDYIYDDFHFGDYYDGLSKFINRMTTYYNRGIPHNMSNYKVNEDGYLYKIYKVPYFWGIIISSVVTFIVITIMIKKNKMVASATQALEYLDKSSINYSEKHDDFITSYVSSYVVSSGSSGGGHHSSSGSSGGGHSSGGGRHG